MGISIFYFLAFISPSRHSLVVTAKRRLLDPRSNDISGGNADDSEAVAVAPVPSNISDSIQTYTQQVSPNILLESESFLDFNFEYNLELRKKIVK